MTRGRQLTYVVLAVFAVSILLAGCTSTAKESQPAKPTGEKKIELKDITVVGDPKAPVKLVAYYPLNKDHKPIAEYLVTLPEKFKKKVYVEVYDMQSPKGREKWSTCGLSCAGVFINGKKEWTVRRGGKEEKIAFVKRMGTFWSSADLEAVIASQLKDPNAVPVVPVEKKPAAASKAPAPPANQPAGKG